MSQPQPVPTDFADHVAAETLARAAAALPVVSPHRGADPTLLDRIESDVEASTPALVALSQDLFAHPEVAFEEHRSAEAVAAVVEARGIGVERGVGGLPTALRAEVGSGGPTIGLMSEYDALPEIGHGCGHNVIAAAGVGAFLALAALGDDLPGRVVWLGTPAEEGGAGKEILARARVLDDLDAALMVHPFGYDVGDHVFLGRRLCRVHFHGLTAHASAQPYMGRNALDAVSLAYQGVGLFRQQMPPSDRIHSVVVDGGRRPNVVPDHGELLFYVRSKYPETLRTLSRRLEEIAQGAALMTGCGVEVVWDELPATLPIRANAALGGRWSEHQAARGRHVLPPGVVPDLLAASTDFGNVSFRVPSLHPMIAVSPPSTSLHTREFADAAVSAAGDRAVADGASGLARTALDYLSDEQLRADVHAEFEAAGGAVDAAEYFAEPER
ncbi:M20 family metallopeptidase [Solicola sp. PLA-1-18]|uniref:M20 family metallopeptidase n=1 Tax=Solicola sp. PLA-1-18 TaxID=3380532 RepID=UPI003B81216C